MIFASSIFLYAFLPIFLALYYLSPRKLKAFVIAFASYVFYGWWRPDFVLLMLISTVVDFRCGQLIVRDRDRVGAGKRWVVLSCIVNLGLLAYFKYANFGIDTVNSILVSYGHEPVAWTEVILPVGISFYTFQTLSYTIDVYRNVASPVRRFGDFMCYVSMFPQLVAGPIVRYNTVAEQLHSRTHTLGKFSLGVLAFQAGMVKKVLIADVLAPVADQAFSSSTLSTSDAWIGTLAYTFQIYFDFSGYSDMAIGLGLMMGFRFPINFDQPYRSLSITEFWRRWHISLSTFLRDYLYIPLGGNQKGSRRTYINLCLTMLLGGLWHGAAWTFIAWGAFQGFWLVLERLLGKRSPFSGLPKFGQMALTFVLIMFGWVLFRSDSLADAGGIFAAMFGSGEHSGIGLELAPLQFYVGAAAILVVWLLPTTQVLIRKVHLGWAIALQIAFLLALLHLHFQDHVPFLYFQF